MNTLKEIKYLVVFLRDDEEELGGKKVVLTGEFASQEEIIKGLGPFKKAIADCEVVIKKTVPLASEEVAEIMDKL
jgi:hypothetical protein